MSDGGQDGSSLSGRTRRDAGGFQLRGFGGGLGILCGLRGGSNGRLRGIDLASEALHLGAKTIAIRGNGGKVADRLVPLAGQGRNLGRVLLGRSEKRGGAGKKFAYVHSTYRLKRTMGRLIYRARLRFRVCVRVIPAGSPSFFRT